MIPPEVKQAAKIEVEISCVICYNKKINKTGENNDCISIQKRNI